MNSTSVSFCSLFGLLLLSHLLRAQPADTLITPGVRFGLDVVGPLSGAFNPIALAVEGSLDANLGRWYAVLEGGGARYTHRLSNFDYTGTGRFGRVGFDLSTSRNDDMIFFGLRYAQGRLSDRFTQIFVPANYWPSLSFGQPTRGWRAHWIELVGGARVRVTPRLFTGFTVRFQVRLDFDAEAPAKPYRIPGFGASDVGSSAAFQYYLYYRFAL